MRHLFFFALLLLLAGCNNSTRQAPSTAKEELNRVWIFDDTQSMEIDVENKRKSGGTTQYGFDTGNFIDLQSDGTFTSCFNGFMAGRWTRTEDWLTLNESRGRRLELVIRELASGRLICLNRTTGNVYRFNGYPNEFSSPQANPFSAYNNRWRLRPARRETEAEITARLQNHFHFWESFFTWAQANGLKGLTLGDVPSVLDMHGNGFQVRVWDEQLPEWRKSFYDTTDCWRAYEKVHYFVAGGKVKWPREKKNRYEAFAEVFRQMQAGMNEPAPKTGLPAAPAEEAAEVENDTDQHHPGQERIQQEGAREKNDGGEHT